MKSFRWSHVISYLIMVIVLVFFAFVLYQVIMLGVHSVSNSFFINFWPALTNRVVEPILRQNVIQRLLIQLLKGFWRCFFFWQGQYKRILLIAASHGNICGFLGLAITVATVFDHENLIQGKA